MHKLLKTNWLSCILLLLLITNCNSPDDTLNVESNKKIIHFEEEWVYPPPAFDTLLLSTKTEYNVKGKPVEKRQYSKFDGSLRIFTKWTYDEHFNLTSRVSDNKEVNQVFQETYSYEFDKEGRKIKVLEKTQDPSIEFIHIYVYHDDGSYTDTIKARNQVVSIIKYNKNDQITEKENRQKKITTSVEFDEHENTLKRTVTSFAKQNVATNYLANQGVVTEYTNKYDTHGNLISTKYKNRFREFEYNENGDIIKESWHKDEELIRITTHNYEYFE